MKLTYWRGNQRNFGDELNPWLWPKLLKDFFDDDETTIFLGIGSILQEQYSPSARKIVAGAGFSRGYGPLPSVDDLWKIYFVRGPRSARSLGIDEKLGIGDPASLVGLFVSNHNDAHSQHRPAFMPHWESMLVGSWREVALSAEFSFIDPRDDVTSIMKIIGSSSILVTEAMHGAIVADALRVPWVPFAPLSHHQSKWLDWCDAMNLTLRFEESAPSSSIEALARVFQDEAFEKRVFFHGRRLDTPKLSSLFRSRAVDALKKAASASPNLSSETNHNRARDRMLDRLETLARDFGRSVIL